MEIWNSLDIPIPSLIVQNVIIEQLDIINENNYTCQKQIDELNQIMKYYVDTNTLFGEENRLGDICRFLPKSKRPASYGKEVGDYDFFTSSMKIKKCEIPDYNLKSLIIGTGGNANIKIGKDFSCSADNFILTTDNENIIKYIFYYLSSKIDLIQSGFSGSIIKHLSKDFVKDIKISFVSSDEQKRIINYCENIELIINKLKKNIENNNILMKTILDNKLKQQSGESFKYNYNINGNNYIKQKVPGDGHCFFHAVALYLERPVEELRDEVATYMLDNQDDFIDHYEVDEHNDITYEEFVKKLEALMNMLII